jgi:hypothetical protein
MVVAREDRARPADPDSGGRSLSRRLSSDRGVLVSLVVLAALSFALRVVLASLAHAPVVFRDELGYMKLAQSIGLDGRMALFGNEGFSYSPLYPALLSPIYALGASAPTAYALIKVVGAFTISLSVFPLYKIARFAMPRRDSILIAGVSILAPLMSFPAFTMSESLAYPLCLMALWAMLAAVREPSARKDAVLLVAILVATAARIQLIVLLPAALTAVLVVAAAGPRPGLGHRLAGAMRRHLILFGVTGVGLLGSAIRGLAGGDPLSILGRYANVARVGIPDPWRVVELAVHHIAGLELAVGIAFIGTLVVTYAFVRAGYPSRYLAFAAVAASFTSWLVLEVAVDAALFDVPGADDPRIHERFLIYAIPLFLVALGASVRMRTAPAWVYVAACAVAVALPAVIPFDRYVNITNGVDTFALLPFGRVAGSEVEAIPYATLIAVWVAGILGLVYVRFVRQSMVRAVLVVAAVSVYGSLFVWVRLEQATSGARSTLPAHADWVDRAAPGGDVILIASNEDDILPALETGYFNIRIARVYTLCQRIFSAEFGEREIAMDESGTFRDSTVPLMATYAVLPARLRVHGRVVARNPQGDQVLVAPENGRLTLAPGARRDSCEIG